MVQLIPVIGQVILLGYGMAVARAVYLGQTELPPIYWVKTIRDGGVFVLTGLVYLIPLLAVLPILLTVGIDQSRPATVGPSNISGIFLTVGITLVVSVVLGRLRIQSKGIHYAITGVIGIALIVTIASTFSNMSTVRANSVTFGNLNGIGILLLVSSQPLSS